MKNKQAHKNMIEVYAEMLMRKRWYAFFLAIGIAAVLGAGGRYVQYNSEYRIFFSEDDPQVKAFDALENIYLKNDNILFVIAPEDKTIFSSVTLDAVETIVRESWKIPFAIRVDGITNFQYTKAVDDELSVNDLVADAREKQPDELEQIKHIALSEPLLINRLLSPQGDVTGVNVTLQLPGKSIEEGKLAVQGARAIATQITSSYPGLQIYMTGTTMLDNAFNEGVEHDIKTLIPIMYAGIIVLMYFLLKSVSCTLAVLLVIGFSSASAMGFAGWAGIEISPVSAVAPTMLMTIAVADSVHVLVSMIREMGKGLNKRAAIIQSLKINFTPVFFTSLTTCVGFLTLNFSDSPPFHDLGNITAFGVASAFAFSVFFLPALIMILPVRVRKGRFRKNAFAAGFANFIIVNQRRLMFGCLAAAIVFALFIPANELNDQFVEYFDENVKFRSDTDFVMENLTGIYYLGFSLDSGEPWGITRPDYLETLQRFALWLKADPRVKQVYSFADIMKRLNKNMHGDDQSFYRIPEDSDLAAQYLLLYELSLPYGQDLNNHINVDKSATRFTVTLGDITTNEIREIAASSEQWLLNNTPPHMHTKAAGTALMFAHSFDRNIKGMLIGTTTALFIISLLLIIILRSYKFGLISIIPNLLPAVLAFGMWGMMVGQVGLALSGVTSMTLGIIVDDTVHFLTKYLRSRRDRGLDPADAIRYAFSTVGRELLYTSIILVGGFLVLTFSSFKINSDMGTLTAITILFALLTDFFLLPALLLVFDKKQYSRVKSTKDNMKLIALES